MVRATASVKFVAIIRLLSHIRLVRIPSVSIPVIAVRVVTIRIVTIPVVAARQKKRRYQQQYVAHKILLPPDRSKQATSQFPLALLRRPPRMVRANHGYGLVRIIDAGRDPHVLWTGQFEARPQHLRGCPFHQPLSTSDQRRQGACRADASPATIARSSPIPEPSRCRRARGYRHPTSERNGAAG